MKKLTAVLMTVICLITMVMPATAQTQAIVTYTAGSVTNVGAIEAGETVTIPVTVRSTSPLCMLQLALHFDPEKWEPIEATETDFLKTNFPLCQVNIAPIDTLTGEPILGEVIIGGLNTQNDTTVTTDTVIVWVTFKALCTIERNEVIAVDPIKAAKYPTTALRCAGVDGEVVIEREPIEKGDVNLDGVVSLPDATLLFYAVNGMRMLTEEQQAMADFDEDGTVSLTDATKLFYYVNGMMG